LFQTRRLADRFFAMAFSLQYWFMPVGWEHLWALPIVRAVTKFGRAQSITPQMIERCGILTQTTSSCVSFIDRCG
jgi:hypothetical protein